MGGPSPAPLPPDAARLFPHHAAADLDPRRAAPFLIERLLEDGDRADLAWLTATFPEAELAAWLARRGGRRLSRRSLAFWRAVLGDPALPAGPERPAAEERAMREDLWPL